MSACIFMRPLSNSKLLTLPFISNHGCRRKIVTQLKPVVQVMKYTNTWTDKNVLLRWYSGSSGSEPNSKKEVNGTPKNLSDKADDKPESATESSTSTFETTIKEKDKLILEHEEKYKGMKDKLLRALAETENVRQRLTKQVNEAKMFGIQGFSRDILEVADILEKATESIPKSELENNKNPPLISLFEGLKLTEAELQKVFQKNGLKQFAGVGEKFDPKFHEALFEVPGDKPGTVAVVSRLGYTLHDRTLRPARVGVIKTEEKNLSN